MPELPEVEAARRAVEEHCAGKIIKRAVIAEDSKVIDGVSSADFQASLLGKTIVSARRKGKNMWMELDSPPFPSFQFGMAGAIYIKGVAVTKYKRAAVNDTDEWPSKYSKFLIELEDGLELSFTDKRRFAKVRLLTNPSSLPPICELGPDALDQPMTEEEFISSLSKKNISIKSLLLDQSYISGIGNWIADEVLYQARIHPLQSAASLSRESCAVLQRCINEVIEKAVEVGADSNQFPSKWIFHSREKKPGKAFVDGKKIEFISAGGRTTAYVPELQKLSGGQATKALTKPKKKASKKRPDEDDGAGQPEDIEEETSRAEPKKGRKRNSTKVKPKEQEDDGASQPEDIKEEATGAEPKKGRKRNSTKGKPKEQEDDGASQPEDIEEEAARAEPKKGRKRDSTKGKLEEQDDEDEMGRKGEKAPAKRKPKDRDGHGNGRKKPWKETEAKHTEVR